MTRRLDDDERDAMPWAAKVDTCELCHEAEFCALMFGHRVCDACALAACRAARNAKPPVDRGPYSHNRARFRR